jgi:hypothetical protein
MSIGRSVRAGAVCLLGLAGCGGTDFTASSPDAGDVDGGSTVDAGPLDDGPSTDAARDAGVPVDAGSPGHWCATQNALFCADFDEASDVDTVLGSWTTFSKVGGQFSLDTSAGVPSPPNALEVMTTSTSGVRTLLAQAIRPFASPPTKMRLELALRIDAASSVGFLSAAAFAAILFGSGPEAGSVSLAIGNGPTLSAVYVEPADGGTSFGTSNISAPFPPTNQWDGRYAIEIDYGTAADGGPSACAQIYAGGVPQLQPCMALPPSLQHPSTVSIAIGVYSGGAGNTGNVILRFDDVTFTAE